MFSKPSALLRLEQVGLLAAGVAVYAHLHASWWMFGLLFFVPDVFMLGYMVNVKVGAAMYNVGHVVFLPMGLFVWAAMTGHGLVEAGATVWFCHVAFDRVFGYGLKYPTQFKDTHLQRVG